MHFSRSFSIVLVVISTLSSKSQAQKANYDLAARWTRQKAAKLAFDSVVTPHWLETNDRFWYTYETSKGREYKLVDPKSKSKKPLFDNAKMAAQLTKITLFPYDGSHLPIRTLKFIKKDTAIQFEIEYPTDALVRAGETIKEVKSIGDQTKTEDQGTKTDDMQDKSKQAVVPKPAEPKRKNLAFEYDLATEKLKLIEDFKAEPKKLRWASLSPDEKNVIFARGHNLYWMDAANYALAQKKADDKNIKETQLTTDGEDHYSFAATLLEEMKKDFQKDEKDRKDYRIPAIRIIWSKDSTKFAAIREDSRKVADLWVINALSIPRPTLETYRYGMPGEENQPQEELLVFDIATKSRVKIKADAFKDQVITVGADRVTALDREREKVYSKWLNDKSDKLYFLRSSRDRHKVDVCTADTSTGAVKVLIEERLNTYIDLKPLRLVNDGKEIIFWSERDGWGHYYLYDENGKLKNQITSGEFVCQEIDGLDTKSRVLYLNACGREPNEDPYFTHLYRVNLDGKNFKLLNPGDAMHAAEMDDDTKYFVDNSSRVDAPPSSAVRDSQGNLLVELEKADVTTLLEAGFKYPEAFKVKADDGVTDLYGVMYKPFDFDARKKYPVIAYVYPGPQTESVAKTFSVMSPSLNLAQFGFIVIEVGNRGGNPQRSKWYHNFGYGNLRDYGLADKKHAIEQLALKSPWIDLEKVGIFGHSGGGFMSAAAMLVYPDFFKVAVSTSGNHENNIYNRWWSESHHGVKEVKDKDGKIKFEYDIEKNSDIAKNLKGRLLLATGDMDNNVHPANTLRLANALIRANKRFDMFVLPGQRHGYGDMSEYWSWLRADYFCKHLLGDAPSSVDIVELNRERQQAGTKRAAGQPDE